MRKGNFWGLLVRVLREESGLSQRKLAALSGVNRATLRKLENGEAKGTIDLLEVLLKFLGYELDAIQVEAKALNHPQHLGIITQDRRSKLAAHRILRMSMNSKIG